MPLDSNPVAAVSAWKRGNCPSLPLINFFSSPGRHGSHTLPITACPCWIDTGNEQEGIFSSFMPSLSRAVWFDTLLPFSHTQKRWMTQRSPHMLHLHSHPQLTGVVIVILELSSMVAVARLLCWISMQVRVVIYYCAYQYTFLMWFSDTILRQIEDVFLQIIHFLWVDSS